MKRSDIAELDRGSIINRANIPTKAEVDELFGEFDLFLSRAETAAGEYYQKTDRLCRGLHWAVCARLNASAECDAIIDASHYRMSETLKSLRHARDLLHSQWQYMRALAGLEAKNAQRDEDAEQYARANEEGRGDA